MKKSGCRIAALLSILLLIPGILSAQSQEKIVDSMGEYVGEVKDGKRNGKGTNLAPDGKKYVGAWKNNLPSGQGTMHLPDGTTYEGAWKDGEPNGRGKITMPDGSTYDGEWKNGVKEGQGTYVTGSGLKAVGHFKDDELTGEGTLYYPNGIVYEGSIQNGRPEGKGILVNTDGSRYDCFWVGGVPNGMGTITEAKGHVYTGMIKDARPHGEGTTVYSDGDRYVGEWENGLPHGWGTYTYASGKTIKGRWEYGEFQKDSAIASATGGREAAETPGKEEAPARKKGSQLLLSKSARLKILFDEALERKTDVEGVFMLVNSHDFLLQEKEARDFLRSQGYEPGLVSTKMVRNPSPLIDWSESIDEMDFFVPGHMKEYAFFALRGDHRVGFDQLDQRGTFVYRDYTAPSKANVFESAPVFWSGDLFNGFLDGSGVGLVQLSDGWGFFAAEFQAGFPTEDIPMKILFRDMSVGDFRYTAIIKPSILMEAHSATGIYLGAIRAYAQKVYPDYKQALEAEYQKTAALNRTTEGFVKNRDFLSDFISFYETVRQDPDQQIPKAKEILEAYDVLDACNKEFTISDYIRSWLIGSQWDWERVEKQREYYKTAYDTATEKSKDRNGAFQPFYSRASEILARKRNDLETHIKRSLDSYANHVEREKQEAEEKNYRLAEYDQERSYPPSGSRKKELSSFYTMDKPGKLYLKNGAYLEYNIVCNQEDKVENYIVHYAQPHLDSSSKEFPTFEAMLQALVVASRKEK